MQLFHLLFSCFHLFCVLFVPCVILFPCFLLNQEGCDFFFFLTTSSGTDDGIANVSWFGVQCKSTHGLLLMRLWKQYLLGNAIGNTASASRVF